MMVPSVGMSCGGFFRIAPLRVTAKLAGVVTWGVCVGVAVASGGGDGGRLIVFVQPDSSEVSRSFAREYLPRIEEVARALGVPVRVVDARAGAPAEVRITPLIVYQNHRGRSIFQGRYASIERVRNFIRTSRAVPQREGAHLRRDVHVFRDGRATVLAPVKIAPVTGTLPVDHDHERFSALARKAVEGAFAKFERAVSVSVGRADRLFYVDFYPWRSEDGQLYLSAALFSQFHCKKPVFARTSDPFVGRWKDRAALFGRAALALESALLEEMANSDRGDGFDAVGLGVPVLTWEGLGLDLPDRPAGARVSTGAERLGCKWVVEAGAGDAARVQFRFPSPLDGYAGEARTITGHVGFGPDLRAVGAGGAFEVRTTSVTMGDPDIDEAIHGRTFLDVERFPTSTFVIERVTNAAGKLAYGERVNLDMHGVFAMRGVSIPLTAAAVFEAIVDDRGAPRLVMRAEFEIGLKPFGLEGPDGPSPQKETLVFEVNLLLKPA